jgi:hypothetical protein
LTIPIDAWDEEPAAVSEEQFTKRLGKGWSAWNLWSVEVEVADFLPRLVEAVDAVNVVETGCGQGYVTRRLDGSANVITFESDDEHRAKLEALPIWHTNPLLSLADHPSPTEDEIAWADLVICDSDVEFRVDEIKRWVEHGKPGSFLWTHDTADHHGLFAQTVLGAVDGLPQLQFGNPRGSTLVYKPTLSDGEFVPPPNSSDPGPSGSVFVTQIDGGEVDGAFCHSMIKAVSYTMQYPGLFSGYLRWTGGPLITKARTEVVKHFLHRTDADWLLMIDSDMVFDPDTIYRLWSNARPVERPIVAGHCYAMMAERGPVPTMWLEAGPDAPGPFIPFEGYPKDALVPVGATGAACLMIHRSVFEKLQAEHPEGYPYPWFEEARWNNLPVGEDLTFCIRARKAGFPIFVDTGLDIGHVKPQLVNHDWFERWRKSRRFVVTGWGRSGTAYMADLLRHVGVSCGHEWVYKPSGPDWGTRWGDSSWLAVPYLDDFDGPVIHIVRDPYKVAESLIGSGMFDPSLDGTAEVPLNADEFRQFVYKHIPGLEDLADPVERTVAFMEVWADRLEQLDVPVYRVEDMDAEKLVEIVNQTGRPRPVREVDVAAAIENTPTNVNARRPAVVVDWSQQNEKVKNVLDGLAVRYGYKKEGT